MLYDERTHGARMEILGNEIEELKHRCCDAACSASSFLRFDIGGVINNVGVIQSEQRL
jgi:hypothetical protein